MKLSARIRQKVYEGSLVMPSLPTVGSKILSQIQRDVSIAELAATIQTDPILCARIVSLSNSAFYRSAIRSVEEKNMDPAYAVQMIGTDRLRSIAISFVLEQLFVSNRQDIKEEMQRDWDLRVRRTCAALALNQNMQNSVDFNKLMLFCMTVNIGILPCLYYIEELNVALESVDKNLVDYVTLNLLRKWDLDFELKHDSHANAVNCADLYTSAILFIDTPAPKMTETFEYLDNVVDTDAVKKSYSELLTIFVGQ